MTPPILVPMTAGTVRCYRVLTIISFQASLIDMPMLDERWDYLDELVGRVGPEIGSGSGDGEPFEEPSGDGKVHDGCFAAAQDEDDSDWLEFIPHGPIGHLKAWQFRESDPDPLPSVPHGHKHGQDWPKLDPYLGWIHVSTSKTKGRLSKDDTRALWNHEPFRKFARETLVHFMEKYPKFNWSRRRLVADPLVLPRRR